MALTHDQFVQVLKSRQGSESLRGYAKSLGVTVGYLSDVYLSRRDAGPTLAAALGYRRHRTVTTRFIKKEK